MRLDLLTSPRKTVYVKEAEDDFPIETKNDYVSVRASDVMEGLRGKKQVGV